MKTLTAAMDNQTAWELGRVTLKAAAERDGDLIDLGLILRRLLEERGYLLIKAEDANPP